MALLLDTGFIFSFYNKDDLNHKASVSLYKEILDGKYGVPYLLDHVFDELMTLIHACTKSNEIATDIGRTLLADCNDYMKLIRASHTDFEYAWEVFQDQKGKKFLSFTDCILVAVSKHLNISHLASFDQRFHSWVKVIP